MNWYLAPIFTDPDTGDTCPGAGSPVESFNSAGMWVHCYDYGGGQCLVGLIHPANPGGWAAQTLQQARDHYEAFQGVAPTNKQVY
jgi:hypothetical protein